ncbi:MAG: hypothetical protein ACKO55_00620 [Bacteroidota bacterium]
MNNQTSRKSNILALFLLCLVWLMGLLWMHRTPGLEGMMTHDALRSTLDYHRSLPVFAARPLTSGTVALLSRWTEVDETLVLALLNPLLLAMSAVMLYALSLRWGANPLGAWMAAALYLFSFPTFFAFVPPMYTFDEPLQMLTLFAAGCCLPRPAVWRTDAGAWPSSPSHNIPYALLAGLWMGLSWWARESGLLLLPILAGLYLPHATKQERVGLGITVLTALGVLIVGRLTMEPAESTGDLWQWQARFSNLQANFRNIDYSVETLVGIFLVLAWPLVLLRPLLGRYRFLTMGFVVSLVINTLMVLLMAKAREARLFALPLMLVWPLLGLRRYAWPNLKRPYGPMNGLILVMGIAGTLHLAWNLYQSTVGPNSANLYREYLTLYGISLGLWISISGLGSEQP